MRVTGLGISCALHPRLAAASGPDRQLPVEVVRQKVETTDMTHVPGRIWWRQGSSALAAGVRSSVTCVTIPMARAHWSDMPELDYITIRGFRSIAEIDKLKLGDINVLIGANGSGKSNFIGVFPFMHALREGQLQDYVAKAGGADRLLHFGVKNTKQLDLHISFKGEQNEYEIQLEPTDLDGLIPIGETVYFWNRSKYPVPFDKSLARIGGEAGISVNRPGIQEQVRRHLASWRLYHLHDTSTASSMKRVADLHDNRFLRPDGSNLPAFLYYLREQQPDSYRLIVETVRQATPFLGDFQLQPQLLNPETIRLEWRHQDSDAYFDRFRSFGRDDPIHWANNSVLATANSSPVGHPCR